MFFSLTALAETACGQAMVTQPVPPSPFAPVGPVAAAPAQGTVTAPAARVFGTTTEPLGTPFGTTTAPAGIAPGLTPHPADLRAQFSQVIRSRYPVISPYQNLYRFNPSGVDNYNLFVRPILEQRSLNRELIDRTQRYDQVLGLDPDLDRDTDVRRPTWITPWVPR